ncbi:MAG: hypothetical protein M1335_07445 [Chloroflexi bacterium]|nr:hypothetical protein [Chloroflexota bacterium]
MDITAVIIVFIVIGLPVSLPFALGFYKHHLKARELRLQEKRLEIEQKLRQDELNAKIIRMDDLGVSPTEIASLAEEVRQLRQEMAQIKQEINNRSVQS